MKSSGKSSLLNLRELKAVTAKFSTRNRGKKQSLFFAMLTHLVFFSLSSHQWTSCAAHSLLFLYSIYWTREHAVSIKRFVNIPHVMRKRGYPIQLKSSMWTPNIKVSLLFSLWSCVSCKNFGKSIFFFLVEFWHAWNSFFFFFWVLNEKWVLVNVFWICHKNLRKKSQLHTVCLAPNKPQDKLQTVFFFNRVTFWDNSPSYFISFFRTMFDNHVFKNFPFLLRQVAWLQMHQHQVPEAGWYLPSPPWSGWLIQVCLNILELRFIQILLNLDQKMASFLICEIAE